LKLGDENRAGLGTQQGGQMRSGDSFFFHYFSGGG
jgi:hypothetical protein